MFCFFFFESKYSRLSNVVYMLFLYSWNFFICICVQEQTALASLLFRFYSTTEVKYSFYRRYISETFSKLMRRVAKHYPMFACGGDSIACDTLKIYVLFISFSYSSNSKLRKFMLVLLDCALVCLCASFIIFFQLKILWRDFSFIKLFGNIASYSTLNL